MPAFIPGPGGGGSSGGGDLVDDIEDLFGTSNSIVTIPVTLPSTVALLTQSYKAFSVGRMATIRSRSTSSWMYGRITAYTAGSLSLLVLQTSGSGTLDDWDITVAGTPGVEGAEGAGGGFDTSRRIDTGTGLSGGGDLSADRTLIFDVTWGDARYQAVGSYQPAGSYVLESRTVSAGTGLTGGGDLSANRSIAFDTTWGDARYQAIGSYVPTTRTVSAGTGLSGGGDLTANRTLSFDITWGDARYQAVGSYALSSRLISAGTGLTGGGSLAADRTLSLDLTYADARYQAAGSYVLTTRTVSAGIGISGGGDLSANRTLSLDLVYADARYQAAGSYVPTTRTVTAGTGISGGGDLSANRTLSLDLTYTDARYVQPARTITAGTGLTGGGDLSANRTLSFDVTYGDARYQAAGSYVPTTRTVSAGTGLSGGGDLTVNRTLSLDLTYADARYQASGSYVPTTRTITAGTGITGGGDLSANRTVSFDATYGDGRYARLAAANAFTVRPTFNSNTPWDSGNLPSPAQTTDIREKLTANRTYYVRTDGSNSNNGLSNTSGGAFLTVQKAMDVIAANLDLAGFTVTVQIGTGTFSESVTVKVCVGQAGPRSLLFLGDTTTPSNVVISAPSNTQCFYVQTGCGCEISGMSLVCPGSTSGRGFFVVGGTIYVGQKMRFGACGYAHMGMSVGTAILLFGYEIYGSSTYHWETNSGAHITFFPASAQVITVTGTPAFGTFGYAGVCCTIEIAGYSSTVTFSGAATGKRYVAETNGVIQTYGTGVNYFPGNVAGTTATGGQYV